jgi:glycogen debranching enzyme
MTEATLDRARVLKNGELFAVFDRFGDIRAEAEGAQGLYLGDTRHLSVLFLLVDGRQPVLMSSTVLEDNAVMTADLATHSDREVGGRATEPGHILRSKLLQADACHERIHVENHGRLDRDLVLEICLDADYADIFEVRGATRSRRGERAPVETTASAIVFSYLGLDQCRRRTEVRFSPPPDEIDGGVARYRLRLGPKAIWELDICIQCSAVNGQPVTILAPTSYDEALSAITDAMNAERRRWATITTSNHLFDCWLARSFEDLQMLVTHTPTGPYPYAGTPWFSTVFGRDGIITALECLWVAPHMARGVLELLRTEQSTVFDPMNDAEPGKILHEARRGEMARLREVPFGRYYGTIDATPLFVYLAGQYVGRSGDVAFAADLWPHVEAALGWIDASGDRDGDGYVEYGTRARKGLRNQGWKDSDDCISHADGELAEPAIALCEVQAYVYGAWQEAARLARLLGRETEAKRLEARAGDLQARFERDFWDEAMGTFSLALDGEKKPCRVRASNAGHCLTMGIASPGRAAIVAESLMTPSMFSGWGIRTLAANESRYSPLSYHNGSVWPHDNAFIAAGFARYGMQPMACRILESLFEAACFYELHRLPELFCGFQRRPGEGPTRYPVACRPQAWAAGAVYLLLGAVLGLQIDGRRGRILLHNPVLPASIDEMAISDLHVGTGIVDLVLRRHTHDVGVEVTRREGSVTVSIVK